MTQRVVTANYPPSQETYSSPATLTGSAGERTIYIDETTVKLPLIPETYTGQKLNFIAKGALSNVIDFNNKTVNGELGSKTLQQYDTYTVFEHNGNWLGMNAILTVP